MRVMQQNNCQIAQNATFCPLGSESLSEPTMLKRGLIKAGGKLKKSERRRQILLELKLRPHVRISALAERFNVSSETLRRDLDALAKDNLIDRAHGGASSPSRGHYPSLNERRSSRLIERERIASLAAASVQDGETVMIDSGSTTIELAKALAFRGVVCTVITNSLPVAMTLGHGAVSVMLCPGEYQHEESAVIGTETLEFLRNYRVDRCMIGASGMSEEGISETVRGFAAVKREMLRRASIRQLLIDSDKFGVTGLLRVGEMEELDTLFTDARPKASLLAALEAGNVDIRVAAEIAEA